MIKPRYSKYGERKPVPVAVRRASRGRKPADPDESGYTPEQVKFLRTIDAYKRQARRPFPTWCEVLAVLVSLGYRSVAEPGPLPLGRAA